MPHAVLLLSHWNCLVLSARWAKIRTGSSSRQQSGQERPGIQLQAANTLCTLHGRVVYISQTQLPLCEELSALALPINKEWTGGQLAALSAAAAENQVTGQQVR